MKFNHMIAYASAVTILAACGGESDSNAPDINVEVDIIEVVGPDAPEDTIVNTAFPITENFDTPVDAAAFFNAAYSALASESASEEEDNFYHSTAGLFQGDGTLEPEPNTWITADSDPHLRLGNSRFTIGQIVSVFVAVDEADPLQDRRKNSTPGSLPDTSTSWGELDLSGAYTVSFCVVDRSEGGNFFVYVDNNTTSSGNSIHGGASRPVADPVSSLVAGQRATFDLDVGTANSFIQLRVDSGGWLVMDDFVIENAANPAPAQPDCATKTTEYGESESGDLPPPVTGVPFTGIPAVGTAFDVNLSVSLDDFFANNESTNFVSMSDNTAMPFYEVTSGAARIALDGGQMNMHNARFTMGDKGTADTQEGIAPTGDIDLSTEYRITLVISDFTDADPADDPGKFQVYIDNNTSGSGNSIHGAASKVVEIAVGDIDVATPYELVIEPEVGTANSFIQIRADSRVGNITIDSISIEYLAPVVQVIDWNIFNGDAEPLADGALILADSTATAFTASSTQPEGSDYFADNTDGTVTFDTASADPNTNPRQYARHSWTAPTAPVYPRYLTALMAVTGNATDVRVLEMDAHLSDGSSGSRVKVILRADGSNQGVQVEKVDGTASPSAYDANATYSDFRIYQVSVELSAATAGTVSVYSPGNDTPLITYTGTLNATTDNYIRFGEASSSNYQGVIDWIIWTEEGAYLPSELVGELPAGLGDTTGY